MLLSLAAKMFGSSNDRILKQYQKLVPVINALEPDYIQKSDDDLRTKTIELRARLEAGETTDDILPEAFATVREASKRTLGLRPFNVQLIGGMVLNSGKIAEMKTGEGKTLVGTLAVYLNALSGKGVHVVTVNDYLAKRDSEWMGQIYRFLGLTVGCILSNISDEERKEAYASDITYGTNNEFGFDYLRENMKYNLSDMVQRPFHFAIVDEVDSILIDEARTPLIISGPTESNTDLYVKIDTIIPLLTEAHFEKDEKMKSITMTEDGVEFVEQTLRDKGYLETGGLYDAQNISLVHHVNQALRAHKMFGRDTDYIVKDNKIIIIDEFTGRMMEGRRYSEGLHQALEAKEGVPIQKENQTLASITFQNYFRLYPKLAGMTGTAMTEAAEFQEIYNLGVVEIPPNVPVARVDENDKIYKSISDKDDAIVEVIREAQSRQQPVLVGTVSIEKSERLSERLKKAKIQHQVLNARHHEMESKIISQAGRPSAVTIATNMAGRGTDIQLGGNYEMRIKDEIPNDADEFTRNKMMKEIKAEIDAAREIVLAAGGLYVIGTERHESRRIDNQLRGRSGRQGDPGGSMFFLSTQDDLMRIFSPEALEGILSNKAIGLKDGEALAHPWLSKALEKAQNRVEQQNFEIRKNLLKFDNVMNDQRKVIYEQRRDIMDTESVSEMVTEMRHETIEEIVGVAIPNNSYAEQWDMHGLKTEIEAVLALDEKDAPVMEWAKEEGIAESEITARLIDISDKKMAAKQQNAGANFFAQIEKSFVLRALDQHWKEHLLHLDHLRQGINLRAFAQRDPLNEYKAEAFGLFESMLTRLRYAIVQNMSRVQINIDEQSFAQMIAAERAREEAEKKTSRLDPADTSGVNGDGEPKNRTITKRAFDKHDQTTWAGNVGRNDPCPCGSGKKYKHCHGVLS
jgi:preprotein translocase subunit SecA